MQFLQGEIIMAKKINLEEFITEYKKKSNYYKVDDLPKITYNLSSNEYLANYRSDKKFGEKDIYIENMDKDYIFKPFFGFHDSQIFALHIDLNDKRDCNISIYMGDNVTAQMQLTNVLHFNMPVKYPYFEQDVFCLARIRLKGNVVRISGLAGDLWELTLNEDSLCKVFPYVENPSLEATYEPHPETGDVRMYPGDSIPGAEAQ